MVIFHMRVSQRARTVGMIAGAMVACAAFLGCVRISGYSGDGTISKVRFFLNPLVRVDFESFSLARPYEAKYRLDGLPKHHDVYEVVLVPDLPISELGQRPKMLKAGRVGRLSLRLLDASGQVIFDCNEFLDKMGWEWDRGQPQGIIHTPFAPRDKIAVFPPERVNSPDHAAVLLEVVYDPEPGAPDIQAKIRVTAGGSS